MSRMQNVIGEHGFVLVTVLVFITVCMMLGIAALETSIFEMKMSNNFHEKNINLQITESALRVAEEALENNRYGDCYYQDKIINIINDVTWLAKSACQSTFDNRSFYYAIEELDENDCVIINDMKPGAVKYYRITVNVPDKHSKNYATLLQSTYTKTISAHGECTRLKKVSLGRQSWRELFVFD